MSKSNEFWFIEHADASYYGVGPWVIDSINPSGWVKMVPGENAVTYSMYVTAHVMTFSDTFEKGTHHE